MQNCYYFEASVARGWGDSDGEIQVESYTGDQNNPKSNCEEVWKHLVSSNTRDSLQVLYYLRENSVRYIMELTENI